MDSTTMSCSDCRTVGVTRFLALEETIGPHSSGNCHIATVTISGKPTGHGSYTRARTLVGSIIWCSHGMLNMAPVSRRLTQANGSTQDSTGMAYPELPEALFYAMYLKP